VNEYDRTSYCTLIHIAAFELVLLWYGVSNTVSLTLIASYATS